MNRLRGKFVSRGRQEYSYQLSREENARARVAVEESVVGAAGQRSSAETLSDVIHSGGNEAENETTFTTKTFQINFF